MIRPLAAPCAFALMFLAAPVFAQKERVPTPTPLKTVRVGTFGSGPVYLCAPQGDPDRVFVVEHGGFIRILKHGVVLPEPFLDLTPVAFVQGEQGVTGLAFHPGYFGNGQFFVTYSRLSDQAVVLMRYLVSDTDPDKADPTSGVPLIAIPQDTEIHKAGCVAFGPDGYLYMSTGDGGPAEDPFNRAQNPGLLQGKILRIDVDHVSGSLPYAIPPGNPFVFNQSARKEIWSRGLRNPWRFSFDRVSGDMWIGDVGEGTYEEIDFEPAGTPGRNYGWRCNEGMGCTGYPIVSCVCDQASFTYPVYSAHHSHFTSCIIGGFVYRGCAIPDLRGTYFFGDLGGALRSFRLNAGDVTDFQNRTEELSSPGDPIYAISSFGEDACGEIYICSLAGGVFKIVPADPPSMPGLEKFGFGTDGCAGPHSISASGSAVSGTDCWSVFCDQAPRESVGAVLIGNQRLATPEDQLLIALNLNVDLLASTELFVLEMTSDLNGMGRAPIPVPTTPALVGATYYLQAVWFWDAPCGSMYQAISTSDGLTVTIQP